MGTIIVRPEPAIAGSGTIKAPAIGRTAEDLQTIGAFQTLIRHSEKRGRFFCLSCKEILNDELRKLPNDGIDRYFKCPGCGEKLKADQGILAALMIKRRQEQVITDGS